MKCWIVRILLCLILGVVTTVGVAWLFAARENTTSYTTFSQSERAIAQIRTEFGHQDWTMAHWGEASNHGYSFIELVGRVGSVMYNRVIVKTGWPMFVMRGSVRFERSLKTMHYGLHIDRNSSQYPEKFLPLAPIWSGFLINTLFYAALWFGLFFGAQSSRRTIRRRRGRCPQCAYDLRGDLTNGCTECGWNRTHENATSN